MIQVKQIQCHALSLWEHNQQPNHMFGTTKLNNELSITLNNLIFLSLLLHSLDTITSTLWQSESNYWKVAAIKANNSVYNKYHKNIRCQTTKLKFGSKQKWPWNTIHSIPIISKNIQCQQYLSCYRPDFDQTLRVGFLGNGQSLMLKFN